VNSLYPLTFKATVIYSDYKIKSHYLEIPEEVVEKLGRKWNLRLICSIAGNPGFSCGLMSDGKGKGVIILNQKRIKQFGLKKDLELSVVFEPDMSKYGMEMPEELEELLEQDPEGSLLFEKLSPGKQRNIIHYVSSVKNSQSRINKAIFMLDKVKSNTLHQ
jgi:hypothetical protein